MTQMTKEQQIVRCLRRCADPHSIFGINVATLRVTTLIGIGKNGQSEQHYRVLVVFDACLVNSNDRDRVEKCTALFLADLQAMIFRFRLNVSSIYVDYFDGKPNEILKGY